MRSSRIVLFGLVVLSVAGVATLSWTQGQDRPAPAVAVQPAPPPGRDLSKWAFFPKLIYRSGQTASEWLQRANGPDGRFVTTCSGRFGGLTTVASFRYQDDGHLTFVQAVKSSTGKFAGGNQLAVSPDGRSVESRVGAALRCSKANRTRASESAPVNVRNVLVAEICERWSDGDEVFWWTRARFGL